MSKSIFEIQNPRMILTSTQEIEEVAAVAILNEQAICCIRC